MIDLNKLWEHRKVMPVVAVDYTTGNVLMHGYMNKEAFAYTLKTKKAWYYKPHSKTIKMKGENSGHVQNLVSITADCEYSSLLLIVDQIGNVCHKDNGHKSCYINSIYKRDGSEVAKRKKFGKVDVDEDFDFSHEDYEDEFEDEFEE